MPTPLPSKPSRNPREAVLRAPSDRGSRAILRGVLLAMSAVLILARPAAAQTADPNASAKATAENRQLDTESLPYTIKAGDLRVLITPALSFDYNDNINLSKSDKLTDYILTPVLNLQASYPISQRNLLQLTAGVGYRAYLDHDNYSAWWLQTGSELSFDMFVKDFWINLHDQFSYTQDASQQAAIAGTGLYGYFQNTAGLRGTWDLQDVTLSLGYDHLNYLTTTSQFDYTDHSSEILTPRAGFRFNPTLTAGLQGTMSFTTYDQKVLNDNVAYNPGIYADWRPGNYFSLSSKLGYSYYHFRQTSQAIIANDQDSWYFDITVLHRPTDVVSYSLSFGHEITLGTYSDTIEDWYTRANVTWSIIKDVGLTTGLGYQNGTQGFQAVPGNSGLPPTASEDFDWLTANLGLDYALTKKLTASLNYRLSYRLSNIETREYTQNQVGLQLTYLFQ